jgi:hypothetical protein
MPGNKWGISKDFMQTQQEDKGNWLLELATATLRGAVFSDPLERFC